MASDKHSRFGSGRAACFWNYFRQGLAQEGRVKRAKDRGLASFRWISQAWYRFWIIIVNPQPDKAHLGQMRQRNGPARFLDADKITPDKRAYQIGL